MPEDSNQNNPIPDSTGESTPLKDKVEEVFADLPAIRPSRLPVARQLVIVASILGGVFLFGASPYLFNHFNQPNTGQTASINATDNSSSQVPNEEPFKNISIAGKGAIVIDARDQKVLYEKSPDLKWSLASLTKLMTALVAREIVDEGAVIPITKAATDQSGDSGLKDGERFSYRNLSDLTLLVSSNDGAFALAAAAGAVLDNSKPAEAFVKAMNVRAKELGLKNTYFRNPTGLDLTTSEAGAYGTARDVATLMQYIALNHPDILEETTKQSAVVYNEAGESHDGENTNQIVDSIASLIGSKTGYTTLSGGNLAVAFDAGVNHPVVVVVLGSTYEGRFSDVLKLVEAAKAELSQN